MQLQPSGIQEWRKPYKQVNTLFVTDHGPVLHPWRIIVLTREGKLDFSIIPILPVWAHYSLQTFSSVEMQSVETLAYLLRDLLHAAEIQMLHWCRVVWIQPTLLWEKVRSKDLLTLFPVRMILQKHLYFLLRGTQWVTTPALTQDLLDLTWHK